MWSVEDIFGFGALFRHAAHLWRRRWCSSKIRRHTCGRIFYSNKFERAVGGLRFLTNQAAASTGCGALSRWVWDGGKPNTSKSSYYSNKLNVHLAHLITLISIQFRSFRLPLSLTIKLSNHLMKYLGPKWCGLPPFTV